MSAPAPNPIEEALANPAPAPTMAEPGDVGPELQRLERPPFPSGCPVKPLGMSSGIDGSQKCYYLDYNGQLVGLEAGNRHGKNSLIALFGPSSDWLEEHFPQWSAPVYEGRGNARKLVKPSEIVGFDQADASRALIEECARRGIFDPSGRMRGRGAHALASGSGLALHCGDKLLVSRQTVDGRIRDYRWIEPGLHDGMVYTAAPPIPRPWHEPCTARPAEQVLALLRTWNWKRELLDPRFMLGWIGGAQVGGFMPWRPNIWVTGGRGTGKSTLNGETGVLSRLFGDGVLRTSNASAAALRQILKNSTVPVLFDEIEAGEDNRRVGEVIELARISSSGGTMQRGGQDHQAHEFTLRSCFQFSSINIPPLQPQDRSRLAILEMRPFPEGAIAPVLAKIPLAELGRKLQRRMIDGLHRLEETKARFHLALQAVGHDARACDQFGTLLACADVLLEDWEGDGLPPDEETAHWAQLCRPEKMAEVSEATAEEMACLQHIITSLVQARGGDEREAIGTWIGRALAWAAPLPGRVAEDRDEPMGRKLEQLGLKLVNARYLPEERGAKGEVIKAGRWGAASYAADKPGFLAVAGSHQALSDLFKGTKWQGGVWKQSLARFSGCLEPVKVKFGHASLTAVLVPLWAFLEEEDLPAASRKEAAEAWAIAQMDGSA